ncbi:Nucleolar 27S pre-rRNA processing, Urb2/Npa2, C-terminal [Plasmopara halstedii]|uniref:Nucleolar 27S pre-rRNA processing, Urb2/Npa2, C-terminal n=1 Tax=Plasmopara halstedii TaxID=4781 RepID=A0A0N7L8D2_PLAHL|nr:Nucleolar 27S pre-rRNA processing, Urb2/Npa2, C-terminal [Plasmopara halstedii]CEG49547.1 Nucleolar 27S pre-rRNA processing, Urb2/Npa2, C-terminal [Plasmopara halstedii]|eukprot:XP_024585916.1 Nucleolar 27S pre-rRNA processing, Urb2/Npa2, C-terminal [Plasmopara halstedii]
MVAWDGVLALLQWQHIRHGKMDDAALLQTGIKLLQPDNNAQYGLESAINRAERAFNLPWQRIASEVLQFALYVVTKSKQNDEYPIHQALRLLQMSLNVFAIRGDTQLTSLSLNSCNLLLSALAEILEDVQHDENSLQTLQDVTSVFCFLFGFPTGSFQLYRPPTNVYAEFLRRALTALFQALTYSEKNCQTALKMQHQQTYVKLVHATLFVFQKLQKTQSNKKKVFSAIAKTSLKDFVSYRHALLTFHKMKIIGVEAVVALLDDIVDDALFSIEHICQYHSAMVYCAIWKTERNKNNETHDKLNKTATRKRRIASGSKATLGLISYQKNLFDGLFNLLLDQDLPQGLKKSVGEFFNMLVHKFTIRIRAAATTKIEDTKTDLKTSRKRTAVVIAATSTDQSPLKFWCELNAVAYSAFQRATIKQDFLPVLVSIFNALFRALCECDLYRVTEDTEEREHFCTMEKVLISFIEVLNIEHEGEITKCVTRASEECEIVSNAARCSPNLFNNCLVAIFELLGVQAGRIFLLTENECTKRYLSAVSNAMVELIHAYFSMRRLDVFLKSAFTIQRAHEGLYKLLMLPSCDLALRKAFIALPPGQMDVLWNVCVKRIASFASSEDGGQSVHAVAIARLLFQTYLQEFYVVSQYRSKISGLIYETYTQLFPEIVEKLDSFAKPLTFYQRELFCILGELTTFVSTLDAWVREKTFDRMFSKLHDDRFSEVMKQLLSIDSSGHKNEKCGKLSKLSDGKVCMISSGHGPAALGFVKLCVFWLRRMDVWGKRANSAAQVACESREIVNRLLVKYVIHWKCWEAVSFYLPELMANGGNNECDYFFREIIKSFISEVGEKKLDGSAGRILCDAGFYEIATLQKVAPESLNTIVLEFVDRVKSASLNCVKDALIFFEFVSSFPVNYLKPEDCGNLLVAVLKLYEAISTPECKALPSKPELCQAMLTWIQLHFKLVGKKIYRAFPALVEQLHKGSRLIFIHLEADDSISVSLISEVLGYCLDIGAQVVVDELLNSVVIKNFETEDYTTMTGKVKRAAMVVEALVAYRSTTLSDISVEEKKFVEKFVEFVTQDRVCEMESPMSYTVLAALIKYQSFLHKKARCHKYQPSTPLHSPLLSLLVKNVGKALAASRMLVKTDLRDSMESQSAAWLFFASFCKEYASFRTFLPPLKTFGYLTAISLSLVTRDCPDVKMEQALLDVITNANTDELSLLLSTILHELVAHENRRKLNALRAMCLLLSGDRKINASRRLLLNERKDMIVEALLQNFAVHLMHDNVVHADPTIDAKTLCIWNLKSFVLVFCKPELFTWNSYEFPHVITAFQPLVVAVSCWEAGNNLCNVQELHELWTSSYTLLLRVVRHYFSSLADGIHHLVQAANALLRLLVLSSASSEYSKYCSDWCSNLARLYGYMKEHDVQLRKHVVYLLMAFILSVTRDKLPVQYQQKLRPGIFALLDVCSPFEKEQLFGALDSTGKSLLKTLDTNYKLTHRYVGKV